MRASWGLIALLLTWPGLCCGQEGPLEKLECLGSALRSAVSWSASYEQEYTPAGMALGEVDSGTVWVAWPDKALFRIGDPVVRVMGLEGRRLRLVDAEVPSCDDHQLLENEFKRIPLAAVLDPRGAVENFSVIDSGEAKVALEPHEPGGVQRVEVLLRDDCMPAEVLVIDPQGARNRLLFDTWSATSGPAGGRWLPAPPEGVVCSTDPS